MTCSKSVYPRIVSLNTSIRPGFAFMLFAVVLMIHVYTAHANDYEFTGKVDGNPEQQAWDTLSELPLSFIANRGETDERVAYLVSHGSANIYFTSEEMVMVIPETILRLRFVNSNPAVRILGTKEQKGRVDYLIGNDPGKWRTSIPTFSEISYSDIYPGIDMVFSGRKGVLKYTFVLQPGSDAANIRLKYHGADTLHLANNGDLVIETMQGILRDFAPFVYQDVAEGRVEVAAAFTLYDTHTYGFEILGNYDIRYPLVIDPDLDYSTYLGGSSVDQGYGIAVDGSGYVYVIGETSSVDFPALNQYQTDPGDANTDVFVTKLDMTQSGAASLLYSTYIGGSLADRGNGIAVDGSGYVYITGETNSADFPVLNQYQTDQAGSDIFVSKLDMTQSGVNSLLYSTYLGGSSADQGNGIAVDGSAYAYVIGETASNDFPVLNQYQPSQAGTDAVITKLDMTQSGVNSLLYSTYLGGSSADQGNGIAVDGSAYVYVTGETDSNDFPVLNQYQTDPGDANTDVFITRLDMTQSGVNSLLYSTYLGGSSADQGTGIAVDASAYVYVTGETNSVDFPVLNQYQTDQAGTDVFITRLDMTQSGVSSLLYSTYIGGNSDDHGKSIAAYSQGFVYVMGWTNSTDFPILNQYQTNQSNTDAFISRFNTTQNGGASLNFSTYLGGSSNDYGNGIAVDGSGDVYLTGAVNSADFPINNQYQTDQVNTDVFVSKLGGIPPLQPAVTTQAVTDITPTTATGNGTIASLGIPDPTSHGICWNTTGAPDLTDAHTDEGATSSTGSFTGSITGLSSNTTYYVRAYATNEADTVYGNEVLFTTSILTVPSINEWGMILLIGLLSAASIMRMIQSEKVAE